MELALALVVSSSLAWLRVDLRQELDAEEADRALLTTPAVFVGRVLAPGGRAVSGALVATSAGGETLTDASSSPSTSRSTPSASR